MRSNVRGLKTFLVTLPLAAVPAALVLIQPAAAEVTAAQEALRILAQAQAADARCDYLAAPERRELKQYVARAALAATSQLSRSAAKAAKRQGTASGRSGTCSPAGAADVRDTLVAARVAIAAADGRRVPGQSTAKETVQNSRDSTATASLGDTAGLGGYGKVVKSYYAERKCRHLSRTDAGRFWKAIVRLHKEVVSEFGAGRVAPIMRKAEREANRLTCGPSSLALVSAGYAAAKNN